MRNIFLFIRRYFNFLLFLLLQGFSIYFIVHYSRYHNALFSNSANQVTGKINDQVNRVEYYFRLKNTNNELVKADGILLNKLRSDFEIPDTASRTVIDSIQVDSLEHYRRYLYLDAKVVYNSVSSQNNFIVLHRGANQQLKEGMGVIEPNTGVVGMITEVSNDYAVVMSLLHKNSLISGKLMHGGETGTISWDGKLPNLLSLTGIPKTAKVAKGDTIITSGYSTSYPKGMLIGVVEEVIPEKTSSNFLIKLRSSANFYNLQFVYIIDNKQTEAINNILDKAKKKNQ